MGALTSYFEGKQEKQAGYKEYKYFTFTNCTIWAETNVSAGPSQPPPSLNTSSKSKVNIRLWEEI